MPAIRTPAQQAAARHNGTRSHGPTTDAGKARAAGNGTRHGLRGGPFALLPGESFAGFSALHAAVAADWQPRDAYEKRWVVELVAAMWRQDRLRAIELATLTAAQGPASEALMKQLLTFARYGARIDKDMAKALQALRVLRNRPDAELAASQDYTSEPGEPEPPRNYTNDLSPHTREPGDEAAALLPPDGTFELGEPEPPQKFTNDLSPRTSEPGDGSPALLPPDGTFEPAPAPAPLNRHQRRRLEALARKRRAA